MTKFGETISAYRWRAYCTVPSGEHLRFASFDSHWSYLIDKLMVLLNLFIVVTSDSILDMVLNSLAVEFIARLDDEYKARYFCSNEVVHRYIIAAHLMGEIGLARNALPAPLEDADFQRDLRLCCPRTEYLQYARHFAPPLFALAAVAYALVCV